MSTEVEQPMRDGAVGQTTPVTNSNSDTFHVNVPALLRWLETTLDGETEGKTGELRNGDSDRENSKRNLQLQDLLDATLQNSVLRRIDSRAQPLVTNNGDFQTRVQNWETLLKNLGSFYQVSTI